MALGIRIEVSGDDAAISAVRKLGESLVMFEGAMETIGKSLSEYFSGQVFASQGGIIGEGWPELSEEYATWKAVNYPGRPPLVRTGEMQSSFTFEADDQSVTVGNTADYFVYHQSTEPRSVMPRRAMMAVNDDVRTIIADIINNDVQRKIADAGI